MGLDDDEDDYECGDGEEAHLPPVVGADDDDGAWSRVSGNMAAQP